jgi:hypothetical protein
MYPASMSRRRLPLTWPLNRPALLFGQKVIMSESLHPGFEAEETTEGLGSTRSRLVCATDRFTEILLPESLAG